MTVRHIRSVDYHDNNLLYVVFHWTSSQLITLQILTIGLHSLSVPVSTCIKGLLYRHVCQHTNAARCPHNNPPLVAMLGSSLQEWPLAFRPHAHPLYNRLSYRIIATLTASVGCCMIPHSPRPPDRVYALRPSLCIKLGFFSRLY